MSFNGISSLFIIVLKGQNMNNPARSGRLARVLTRGSGHSKNLAREMGQNIHNSPSFQ